LNCSHASVAALNGTNPDAKKVSNKKRVFTDMQAGYHVIFLSRSSSLQPFVRRLPSLREAAGMLDILSPTTDGSIDLSAAARDAISPMWDVAVDAIKGKKLHTIHFSTVFEYLAYLEVVAQAMRVPVQHILCTCPNMSFQPTSLTHNVTEDLPGL
jgi:hypothetical protein